MFNNDQINLMNKIGLNVDFKNLTDNNYVEIEKCVNKYKTYLIETEEGDFIDPNLCDEILEFINIKRYIDNQVSEYKKFMDIQSKPFPKFDICVNRNLQGKREEGSIQVLARAKYKIDTGRHTLCVAPDIVNSESNVILFHELTHILDTEMYCKKHTVSDIAYDGYSGYHAAQIDMLKFVGAKSINKVDKFSIFYQPNIDNHDTQSVLDYLLNTYTVAMKKIKEPGCLDSFSQYRDAIEPLFNYWGRRSICRMYSYDYDNKLDKDLSCFKSFFAVAMHESDRGWGNPIKYWDCKFNGKLKPRTIKQVSNMYYKTVCRIAYAKKWEETVTDGD